MKSSKNYKSCSWYVHKDKVRTDYVVIENLDKWLVKEVPQLHPDHPDYIRFWSKETKKCIEGVWGKEFGKYRYMPGCLYFFGNYGIIEHTWKDHRGVDITDYIKPYIVDFIWDYAYQSICCYGFSGFTTDDEYSCNLQLKKFHNGKLRKEKLPKSCINSKGEPKKYQDAFEYLNRLHSKSQGLPIFENPTENSLNFGTRGSAKSYWAAIGEVEYNFIFRGARRYDEKFVKGGYVSQQCCGAAESGKSADMLNKFSFSQDCKTSTDEGFRKWFGTWVETEYDSQGRPIEVVTPCPFYQRTLGTLNCPNKSKTKIFRSRYKVELNGEWKEKGVGCSIVHVNYSDKKGNGERAAEGGRYLFCNYEEIGSMPSAVQVFNANEGTVSRGGVRFGVQNGQGTSGNIEYVQATKKIFLNPQDYNVKSYRNKFSSQGKNNRIANFIPFYITLFQFKDKNGNTDYDEAINFVNEARIELAKSDDPRVLRDFLMNKPCYVPEMWLTDKGYYLPYEEAAERERQLMDMQLYKELGLAVEMYWDTTKENNVWYKPIYNREPIYDWPLPKTLEHPDGCVVIYEHPEKINKSIPNDMYCFVGHDPYVAEDIDRGGSLGVTYILKNPKYISQGHTGNIIVASYIGKPEKGLDYYYEQQEKLLAYYGNPDQGLWYEKNMGQDCRNYYLRKNKANLLAITPQYEQGSSNRARNMTSWGYTVGAHGAISKKLLIKKMRDWLLEPTEMLENGELVTKQNIYRIPCIFLIRQMMDFNMEPGSNFDACFAKGTKIITQVGDRNIEDVEVGDFVYTQTKGFFPIVQKHINNKSTYLVKYQGDYLPIETTNNHPFWVASNTNKPVGTEYKKIRYALDKREFKKVKDIVPNKDHVLIPKRKLKKSNLSDEFLYLLGWYMGDGYCYRKSNQVRFTLSLKESLQASKLLEILKMYGNPRIKKRDGECFRITCSSKVLKKLLYKYGGEPNAKRLHDDIYMSSNTFPFLLGFIEAEGHKEKTKGNISFANTNVSLMRQIRQMLIDNSIYNTIHIVKARKGCKNQVSIDIPYTYTKKFKQSSIYNFNPSYNRKWEKLNAIEKEEGFYVKVTSIKATGKIKEVYNLSVLNDNTYFANNILVHNCMGFLGCIVGLREYESKIEAEVSTRPVQDNFFKSFLSNPKIFKKHQLN